MKTEKLNQRTEKPCLCNLHNNNKNLCGRDGRTICGPQCVPKSTWVSL